MNSQTNLGREASRQSFIFFIEIVLPLIIPNFVSFLYFAYLGAEIEDAILNPHSRNLAINLPPRHGKSFVLVAFIAWYLGKYPDREIILMTHSQSLANDLASKVYQLMRSSTFKDIFPAFRLQEKRESMSDFRTAAGGGFYAGSFDTNVTGRGADVIIIDDALSAQEAASAAARNFVRDSFTNMLASRLNNPKTGRFLSMCHRLHDKDLTGHLIDLGFKHLKLPFVATENEDFKCRGVCFTRAIGHILQPGRLSVEQLQTSLAPHVFATQYQQNPTAAHSGMIKAEYFPSIDTLPSGGRDVIVISWDIASSLKPESSYSVALVFQKNGAVSYLKYILRERLGYVALKLRALELEAKFRPAYHLVEDASSGRPFVDDLKVAGANAILVPVKGSKTDRVEEVFPTITNKSVWLFAGTPHFNEFIEEVTAFPNGNNDDMVDALTQYLNWSSVTPAAPKRELVVMGAGRRLKERGGSRYDVMNRIKKRY